MIIIYFDEKKLPEVLIDAELYFEDKPDVELIVIDNPADIQTVEDVLTHLHNQEVGRMNYPSYAAGY